jgi:threonine dehydrogenase-like Zn-dependent dehydrogenase
MKAIRLAAAQQIDVADVDDPEISLPTDALVRVTHSAICGADLMPYHGFVPGFDMATILGHEFVGTVVEVGGGVASVEVGQRVVNTSMTSDGDCVHCRAGRFTQCESRSLFGFSSVYPRLDGGQAEYVRVPLADRTLWRVPDGVSSEDAVFVADILPTGLAAVERGGLRIDDLVVVMGCGPVGLMAIMCAVGTARRVIGVDTVPARLALAQELGAIAVTPDEVAAEVAAATRGLGADVVIEASGSIQALTAALSLVRPQGVISVVGAHFEPDFPLNNGLMFEKEISIVFSVGNPTKDRERLFNAIEGGALHPARVLTDSVPLVEAVSAYRSFDVKQATKIVLVN